MCFFFDLVVAPRNSWFQNSPAPPIFFNRAKKQKQKQKTAFFLGLFDGKNQGPPLECFPRVVLGPVVESLVQNPWFELSGWCKLWKNGLGLFGVLRLMFLMFRCWLLLGTGVPSSKCICINIQIELSKYLFIHSILRKPVGSQSNRIISQRIEKKI